MLCASFNMLLSLSGRRRPSRSVGIWSVRDPWKPCSGWWLRHNATRMCLRLLAEPGERLGKLAVEAPEFHAAVLAELALIGHRGPAELEMLSTSYADDPELLVRMVTRAIGAPPTPRPPLRGSRGRSVPWWRCSEADPPPGSPPRQGGSRELGVARAAA